VRLHWGRGSIATAACGLAVLASAAPADAQAPRYEAQLSLTGAAVYDDNIYFERRNPTGGAVIRFRPLASGTFRATRDLSFEATYSFDADYYPSQPELSDAFASHGGALNARWRAGQRTSFNVGVQGGQSATAGDLFGTWGLELGRVNGTTWGAHAGVSRQVTRAGSASADYSYQTVTFGDVDESHSHGLSLNWNQQLTTRTDLSLSFGPRFVDGESVADATATVNYRLEHATLSAGYGRSRYPAPGRDVDTQSVMASGTLQLSPTVQLSASPSFYWHEYGDGPGGQSRSLRFTSTAAWQARPSVSARLTYQYIRQEGAPGQPSLRSLPWIERNLLALSVTVGMGRPRRTSANPGIGPVNPAATR
jgi:hypothetical protein